MAKQRVLDSRFDFRAGLNLAVNPDLLADNELLDATNARLQTAYGAIAKRTGSQRMHSIVIGVPSAINGLVQWDSPSGKQLVAIANGNLYHKTTELGNFTVVSPTPEFSLTAPALFATFRDKTAGAPLRLYIASGGVVYHWSGTALTRVDGVNSAPEASLIASYHTRLFANHIDFPKFIHWSEVGVGTNYVPGALTEGGAAMVDTLSGDALTALETVGSSILLATRNTIVRFSGHSSDDIVIAQDTEGVSSEVGVVNAQAITRAEEVAPFASDRGPYLAAESGVQPIGVKVEPVFDNANLATIAVEYHRGRREIWFAMDDQVLVYSIRLQSWYGPFTYPFTIRSLARYEDSAGNEWIISGGTDGFVRHMDTGALDDVLSSGSGGVVYTMTAELPPIFFQPGPGVVKALDTIALQADVPTGSNLAVEYAFDGGALDSDAAVETTGVEQQRIDLSAQGYRLRLRFVDSSATIPIIHGYVLQGWDYGRP